MLGDDCEDLMPYLRGELCPQVDARFKLHVGGCEKCQRELVDFIQREYSAGPTLADRAQEVLVIAIGLVQLGRELAPVVASYALLALVTKLSPMREWADWMGGGARWRVR